MGYPRITRMTRNQVKMVRALGANKFLKTCFRVIRVIRGYFHQRNPLARVRAGVLASSCAFAMRRIGKTVVRSESRV
jgi:hypothetical protein